MDVQFADATPEWAFPPEPLAAISRSNSLEFKQSLAILYGDRRNRSLIEIFSTFVLLAAFIYILVRYPGPWTYVGAFLGIGLMQYRMMIACHEAVHKTLLFPFWLNELCGLLHCALVGINFTRYRRQHVYHHRSHDVSQDPDAYIYAPILRVRPGFRRVIVWIFGTAAEVVEKFRQKGPTGTGNFDFTGKAKRDSIVIIAVQVALVSASAFLLNWWTYFAFWTLPLLTVAVFMNRTRVMVEHGYAYVAGMGSQQDCSSASVQTVDVASNPLERFFLAPYLFNYHFAHHSVPSVPHYNNPALARLLAKRENINQLRVSGSYIRAIVRVLAG